MMKQGQLSQLLPGQCGTVLAVRHEGDMRRRLYDLGFFPGNEVRCLFDSPLCDPVAYEVLDTVIALRRADAALIDCLPEGGCP